MKVLFVSSGNSFTGISPVVENQGRSLIKCGIDIEYALVTNKGIQGYLKSIIKLHNHLKRNVYDVVHAHYSLSAIVAILAGAKPLVISLMGSDVLEHSCRIKIFLFFFRRFCSSIIVKTHEMAERLGDEHTMVIPNGVDTEMFVPLNKGDAKRAIGLNPDKHYILFAANPKRLEKNFSLAQRAYDLLKLENTELIWLQNIPYEKVPFYMNASELVVLSSLWEGSPNVAKEAMACNCPMVSTDVGDVRWLIGNTKGCYISSFDPKDMMKKMKWSMNYGKKTNGRQRILELGLDSKTIALIIYEEYKNILRTNFKNN